MSSVAYLLVVLERLNRASTLHQVENQHDDGHDEQDMNQRATYMANEPKQPQDEQDYKYGPQHSVDSFLISRLTAFPIARVSDTWQVHRLFTTGATAHHHFYQLALHQKDYTPTSALVTSSKW
jgi:hypothetical protein